LFFIAGNEKIFIKEKYVHLVFFFDILENFEDFLDFKVSAKCYANG
jgi:hypothetical protein